MHDRSVDTPAHCGREMQCLERRCHAWQCVCRVTGLQAFLYSHMHQISGDKMQALLIPQRVTHFSPISTQNEHHMVINM